MNNKDELNHVNIYSDANLSFNTHNIPNITNQNTQEKPQNTNNETLIDFLKKNKKIIIISVASIIVIAVAIVLIIVFTKPNKNDSNDKNEPFDNPNINTNDSGQNNNNSEEKEDDYVTLPNNEKVVTKLSYNINELAIYNEQSNTTMTYSYDPDSNLRRLTETITTVKNYKFLSFIYDIKNTSDGIEQYSAYFTVLEKFTEENGENNYDFFNNFIDNNVDELNDNSDSSEMMGEDFKIKPVLKAVFYQNGTIGDILYPEGVNEELKSNVVNFIEKITPILSQKKYTKNSRLLDESDENKHVLTYEKDKNKLNEKKVEKNKDYGTFSIEDSKINSNIERTINSDNKIGKIVSNSETNLVSNISNQIDKPNYGGLVDLNEDSGDENNVIKFPIGSISTNNSESMELIKNNQNETLKDFISEYIKDYKYISTKNVNNDNKRRLSNLFNVNPNEVHLINDTNTVYINNINDLRNLAEKYNVLQQQINYAFSLAKTNIAGFKFGIMAVMSFSPQNGTILFKVICRTDKEEIIIGNYNISTNYDKLINVIAKISDVFQNKITLLYEEFSNNFYTWKKDILKNLKTLTDYIKDPYNMVDIFSLPLSNLYNKIREISLDNFSEVKTDIIKVDEDLLVIKEELNNDSEANTKKILSTSKSDFSTFIENTEKLFNDFHKKTLEMISEILNKLEEVDTVDIDTYYRIIEVLNETYFEYEIFSKKLSNAISKNKEDFISYSNNYKDSKIGNILNEFEYMANKLNTNETLIETMTDRNRLDMIQSLNNYRKTIDEMIDLIYNKINNTYNNLVQNKTGVYMNLLDNIQTKISEFKEKRNELLAQVRTNMQLTDDFEIYTKHLKILDSIHERCIFNRIKLLGTYFTYPISILEDTYLTNNVINTLSEELDALSLNIINDIKNKNSITDSLNAYKNKFDNILSEIYGDNLISNYKNIYANKNFLSEKEKNYYEKLEPFYLEFNTTFFEQYFKLEFKKYVDKPTEIYSKFSQFAEIQKIHAENPAGEINEIIFNTLKDLISKAYENYLNIIKNDYNIISATVDKTNSTLIEEINNFFNDLYSNIESEKDTKKTESYIKNILSLSDDDPFELKAFSLEKEKDFYTYKIIRIRNNVEGDFKLHFCENSDTIEICNSNALTSVDKHNYNMAKIRNEIEHYHLIPNYAKDLLTDELVVDLNGDKFVNLFLNNVDFGVESVKNGILNYIKLKNDEEYEIFNPYINKFKTSYKEVFEQNLNTQLITNKLEILASLIFTNKLLIKNKNYEDLIEDEFNSFKNKWKNKTFYLYAADFQNSFNSLYANLKENLYTFNNFVDNLTLDESIIKSTSDYYKSIFDDGHREILKKIFDLSTKYNDFKLLNITLNLNDIGKEAMKELKETYYSHIESETNRIYNLKFDELKSNIKNYIKESVDKILLKLNSVYESKYLNLSQESNLDCQLTEMTPESDDKCENRSKVQLKSLDEDFINSINNYANTYKTYIEETFSQSEVNNQIIKFENGNKTSQLIQNYNFDEIGNIVTQNAQNLSKICEETLEKEKAEFKTEINSVIENEFKNIVTNFANGYGNNFMNDVYNKIYTYSIKNQFDYFNKILINAHSYVKDTLFSNISSVEEHLKYSILNVYNNTYINIQSFSQNNINEKMTNSINNLIENSNSIVVNKFSEIILNAINNEKYISTFSPIIYNLIPKEFTYSFSLLLKDDYSNIIKNINFNNLVNLFTESLNSEISDMKNMLNNQENEMINLITSKTSITTKTEILSILNKITNFKSPFLIDFQKDLEFSNSEDKKNHFVSFIDQKIYSTINVIINSYHNIDSDKSAQIQIFLDNFKDYSEIVINNLNSETITQETQKILDSIKNIIETEMTNYLLNSFIDLDLLITNNNTIDLTLKKENNNFGRNLVDLKINKIEEALNMYKKDYLNKTSQLSSSTEIVNLQKEYSNFKSVLTNSIINVGNPITNYLDVLKGYLTQSQLLSFSNQLNKQLEIMKTNVNNFITNESIIIDESLKLVKNILPELFNSNKDAFKSSIDSSLLKLYDIILPNVNNVDESDSQTKNDINVGNYNAILPGNVQHTFSNLVKSLNYQNIIKLVYNNDYTFSVIMSTSNVVKLRASFSSTDVNGGFDGIVADINISVNALNNFAVERVDFEAKNEKKGADYNNWIQYRVRKCWRTWYGKKKCKYVWQNPTYSHYKEVSAVKSNFTKTYIN